MELSGRIAIVTGGGRGIGKAIATALSKEGAKVVVVARTQKEIKAVARQIQNNGGDAIAVQADVSKEEDVAKMVSKATNRFQKLNILVNNAAINLPYKKVLDITLSEWNRMIEINLTSAFLCMKAVLPKMIKQRSGKIINISSIGARRGAAGRSPYRASKAALINLTESVASEVKEFCIDVNAICPGPTDTPMQGELRHGSLPTGLMQPQEIAEVVAFLVSDKASGITGTAIDVFGAGNPLFGVIPPPQPAS